MIRRPPSSTLTAPLFPYTPLFRSPLDPTAYSALSPPSYPGSRHSHMSQPRRSLRPHGGLRRGGRATYSRVQLLRLRADMPVYADRRSEEHTSELQSLMRISYAVFCLKKKKRRIQKNTNITKT